MKKKELTIRHRGLYDDFKLKLVCIILLQLFNPLNSHDTLKRHLAYLKNDLISSSSTKIVMEFLK